MKRVEAVLGGKKKQCTKLPKPAAAGKRCPVLSLATSPAGLSEEFTGRTKQDDNNGKVDVAASKNTVSFLSGAAAGGNNRPVSVRRESSGDTSSTAATSPKRVTREVSGGAYQSKGRLRLDSEGRIRNKSETSRKAPFKEVARSGVQDVEEPAAGKIVADFARRQSGHEDPIYVRHNRYTEDRRNLTLCDGRTHPSAVPVVSSQPGVTDGRERQDTRIQATLGTELRYASDKKVMSYEEIHYPDRQVSSRQHQGQSHRQPHGILKDSGAKGTSHHSQDGNVYPYGTSEAHRDNPYGTSEAHRDNPYVHNPHPLSRTAPAGTTADQLNLQDYGSLPRRSNLANPPPENIYGTGLTAGHHTADSSAQHGSIYSGHLPEDWRSHPRRRESDSGYSRASTDRDHGDSTYAVINYGKRKQAAAEQSNKTYAVMGHIGQPKRPGSVPPYSRESPETVYGVARPGSVPPSYYSDSETGNYQRCPRSSLRRDSKEEVYGVLTMEYPGRVRTQRSYETASDYASGSSSSLRAHHEDEKYRTSRRAIARRHTAGASANRRYSNQQETEKKREAFMQLLAQRYPQYADKIQGVESTSAAQTFQHEKPSRTREGQRRRTAVVTYNSNQAVNTLEYDDLGTMSDLELPSFQRGGFMRTSLPIVRSASTSLERPLGLVFLVYGDQTKKSMLPNEITTLDTVRALFVRAFQDLTLEMLEDPRKKIYLLDPATNIYFQLEDLMDIKDRSVLKIHETDSDQPQKVRERQEVRGRTVQMPVSRPHSRQAYGELPVGHDAFAKSQSLPPQAPHDYAEMMQEQRNLWELERRSRSRTPEYVERPRSLSAGASSRQRFSHSPDRLPTPERVPLNPIPENRQLPPGYQDQGNYYETVGPGTYRSQYSSGIYESPAVYQSYPPSSPNPNQQTYIAHSTRATTLAFPQRAITPAVEMKDPASGTIANRHSLAFASMSVAQAAPSDGGVQHSQNYHSPTIDRDGTDQSGVAHAPDDMTRDRIEKMEQQLASLTAWVHYQKDGTKKESTPVPRSTGSMTSDGSETLPASSASKHAGETPISTVATSAKPVAQSSGLSDICGGSSNQRSSGLSSRESTPLIAQTEVGAKLAQLKSDLHVLRRQQQLNMEAMRDEFLAASTKIKKVLLAIPGAQNQLNFHKRTEATHAKNSYLNDKQQVDKELSDLEASVEELRADIISKQCRVNASDVEGMALLLSNITKALADLKARFPELQNLMKSVMDAELRVVVSEEKFLREEPTEIEQSLKRCKKITGTLYTLKRLASVQDHRPPQVPNMAPSTEASLPDQKKALLENIRALVPDHEQRIKEMEAADASRERKKKISSQQEALKFGKSLEIASKNLRPPSLTDVRDNANDEDGEMDDDCDGEREGLLDQGKSVIPAKQAAATVLHSSSTVSAMPSSVASSSVKSSFSASSSSSSSSSSTTSSTATTAKPMDKPTATVSAMTAGVSETVTVMTSGWCEKETSPTIMKNISLALTQTVDHPVSVGSKTLTHSVQVGTDSPKKKDATVYAYQVSGSVNPVFPVSHSVFNKHEGLDNNSTKTPDFKPKSTSVGTDKSSVESSNANISKPSDLPLYKADSVKMGLALNPAVATYGDTMLPPAAVSASPDSKEKADFTAQRQAARSAFFSSLNTPPDSPSTAPPNRNSAGADQGPSSAVPGVKVSQGQPVNLSEPATAGSRPASLESFTTAVSSEVTTTHQPAENRASSSLSSPTRGIPRHVPENKSPLADPHTSSDSGSRQKKVPPPPPPRKGSRPTSASISPVHSGPFDSSTQQTRDMSHFAGGVMGQHRLSGPLFSTPKPSGQQKPLSRFEQDIASGIYANMNRPDIQGQRTSPHEMMTQANTLNNANAIKNPSQTSTSPDNASIPPPPSVTIALDREERASSSESSSSSSGTSMGSQQSVVSVVRSSSISDKGSSKPKPDPPKRQSSLLAKFTSSKDSKNKLKNGKPKVSGIDL